MKWSLLGALARSFSGVALVVILSRVLPPGEFAFYFSLLGLGSVLSVFAEMGASQVFLYGTNILGGHLEKFKSTYFSGLFVLMPLQLISGFLLVQMNTWNFQIFLVGILINALTYVAAFHRVLHEKLLRMNVVFRAEMVYLGAVVVLWGVSKYQLIAGHPMFLVLLLLPYVAYLYAISSGESIFQRKYINASGYVDGAKNGFSFAINSGVYLLSQQIDLYAANFLLGKESSAIYVFAKTTVLQMTNVFYSGVSKFTNAEMAKKHSELGLNENEVSRIYRFYCVAAIILLFFVCFAGVIYTRVLLDDRWSGATVCIAILSVSVSLRFFLIPVVAKSILSIGINKVLHGNTLYIFALVVGLFFLGMGGATASEISVAYVVVAATFILFTFNVVLLRRG